MLNLKRLGGVIAIAVGLAFGATAANATSYNLGTIPSSGQSNFLFGGAFGSPGTTSLVDSIAFKVTGNSDLNVFGANLLPPPFNFTNLVAELFTVDGGACSLGCLVTPDSSTSGSIFALSYAGLQAGSNYLLKITGTLGSGFFGAAGGLYQGLFAVSAVPVPPALILFGTAIAGMATLARRRRKSLPVA